MKLRNAFDFIIKYKFYFVGVCASILILGTGALGWFAYKKHQIKKLETQIYQYKAPLVQSEKNHGGSILDKYSNVLVQKKVSEYVLIEEPATRYLEFLKSIEKPYSVHLVAALELSQFFVEYSKPKEALELLDTLYSKSSSSRSLTRSWIYALLLLKLGSLFMEESNFTRALHTFSSILDSKKAQPFHFEALTKMALCYEALGENSKAQEIHTSIQENKESSLYKEKAVHYNRFIKIKNQLDP